MVTTLMNKRYPKLGSDGMQLVIFPKQSMSYAAVRELAEWFDDDGSAWVTREITLALATVPHFMLREHAPMVTEILRLPADERAAAIERLKVLVALERDETDDYYD